MAKPRPASARRKPVRASTKPRATKRRTAAVKRKGGPVPGTPSPMRTQLSPELHAHARRLYEETEQPVRLIGLDCGVDESVMRRMGKREGWVRFVPPPRDLPPVAKLLGELEALEQGAHSVPALASLAGGREQEAGTQQHIERFIAVVMAHLDEFEAVRRDGRLIAKHHLATARAISILTEAFNRLQRLRAAQPGSLHDDLAAIDMPADLDQFRLDLARRIDAFIASRADAGADGGAAVAPADGAQ